MSMSIEQEIAARALRTALLKARQTDAENRHSEIISTETAGVLLAIFRVREAFRATDATFDFERFDGIVHSDAS